jgi:protein TonB
MKKINPGKQKNKIAFLKRTMIKLLYTLLMLSSCTASFAQQPDPGDLAGIDKPLPPKVVQKAPPSVFTNVDQMPEYPGGSAALLNYINNNIQYPEKAKKNNIQGRVMISFVIDEEGSVVDEKVTQSIGGGCDEEALRVVKGMPQWKPGLNAGKPVKVHYLLPLTFYFKPGR